MKNLLAGLLALLPCVCLGANNNIKMVTYFPVPYVAYSDVKVSHHCDVGLAGPCSLKSGGVFEVKNTLSVRHGSLTLNQGNITGDNLSVGEKVSTTTIMTFGNHLNVSKVSLPVHMLESEEKTTIGQNLYLAGYKFPKCEAANHEISWQQLNLGEGAKVYLTCGEGVGGCEKSCGEGETLNVETCECEGTETGCENTPAQKTQTEKCSDGSERSRRWDESTCAWGAWDRSCPRYVWQLVPGSERMSQNALLDPVKCYSQFSENYDCQSLCEQCYNEMGSSEQWNNFGDEACDARQGMTCDPTTDSTWNCYSRVIGEFLNGSMGRFPNDCDCGYGRATLECK